MNNNNNNNNTIISKQISLVERKYKMVSFNLFCAISIGRSVSEHQFLFVHK